VARFVGSVIGIAIAGLIVALVAALVIGFAYYLLTRPRSTFRDSFGNRLVVGTALAIGVAFVLIRWLQGAFNNL
jgi:hypothetical protein